MEQLATIPLVFRERVRKNPEVMVQAYKIEGGCYGTRTYRQLYEDVLDFACALQTLGVSRSQHIGLISDNRREWLISDLAIQSLGSADVPRGCDSMEKEIVFILSTTDCPLVIVENKNQLTKVLNGKDSLPHLKRIIMFNEPTEEDRKDAKKKGIELFSFWTVLGDGTAKRAGDATVIEAEIDKGTKEDLATIIFTSGTTGEPKGVMLTQGNYIWQLERTPHLLYGEPGDIWLTVLPVWHSFERLMQYIVIERSSGMVYSKPVASVMFPDIAAMKPHVIPGVPRLWDALANGILRTVRKEGGLKKALFFFFLSVGKKYCTAHDLVFGRVARFTRRVRALDTLVGLIPWLLLLFPRFLGNVLVYRKIRQKLGGRIRFCISGGGALQKEVDAFYRAIGLKVIEGYGITETAPVLSLRDQWKPRPGCVGAVFTDTECRIVDSDALDSAISSAKDGVWMVPPALPPGKQGVIVVRGGQVMKGYYKRDDLTKKAIDADGWFNTGDLGMLSWDNEIKITGRAKDTIVLLGGENIEPAPIEQAIKSFEFVESVVVLGQDKKYLTALIVPSKDLLLAYAEQNDLPKDDWDVLLEHPEVLQLFRSGIDARINHQGGFRPFEFIFRFTLLKESFQVGRELSGKQEMMRHRINEVYKKEIEALFTE